MLLGAKTRETCRARLSAESQINDTLALTPVATAAYELQASDYM